MIACSSSGWGFVGYLVSILIPTAAVLGGFALYVWWVRHEQRRGDA